MRLTEYQLLAYVLLALVTLWIIGYTAYRWVRARRRQREIDQIMDEVDQLIDGKVWQ